jgi:hypothetical protein
MPVMAPHATAPSRTRQITAKERATASVIPRVCRLSTISPWYHASRTEKAGRGRAIQRLR